MTIIYDGSFEGLLGAVGYALKTGVEDVVITTEENYAPSLFDEPIVLATNNELVDRMKTAIVDLIKKPGLESLWKFTLSEKSEVPQVLFSVLGYMFRSKKNILGDFADPKVLFLQKTLKQISRERHRMTAFVRFKKASNGVYFAEIEPDFDVLPLISKHFAQRYADQSWVIYDKMRDYGLFYDLKNVHVVTLTLDAENSSLPAKTLLEWDEEEKEFQTLWKDYFHSTHIPARKNKKLHLQHVPKRYWKYLTEKQ
ncbi:MAG: TIGR03915 family putative DNA repair protein [Weeksellaceae bacterium]|nr:TIGR03915 family putative DNA repair protein [Weeksellaceae bacterium]